MPSAQSPLPACPIELHFADVGTLEPGKRADLIAVAGDPLADVAILKQVSFVMKDGVAFKDSRRPDPAAGR